MADWLNRFNNINSGPSLDLGETPGNETDTMAAKMRDKDRTKFDAALQTGNRKLIKSMIDNADTEEYRQKAADQVGIWRMESSSNPRRPNQVEGSSNNLDQTNKSNPHNEFELADTPKNSNAAQTNKALNSFWNRASGKEQAFLNSENIAKFSDGFSRLISNENVGPVINTATDVVSNLGGLFGYKKASFNPRRSGQDNVVRDGVVETGEVNPGSSNPRTTHLNKINNQEKEVPMIPGNEEGGVNSVPYNQIDNTTGAAGGVWSPGAGRPQHQPNITVDKRDSRFENYNRNNVEGWTPGYGNEQFTPSNKPKLPTELSWKEKFDNLIKGNDKTIPEDNDLDADVVTKESVKTGAGDNTDSEENQPDIKIKEIKNIVKLNNGEVLNPNEETQLVETLYKQQKELKELPKEEQDGFINKVIDGAKNLVNSFGEDGAGREMLKRAHRVLKTNPLLAHSLGQMGTSLVNGEGWNKATQVLSDNLLPAVEYQQGFDQKSLETYANIQKNADNIMITTTDVNGEEHKVPLSSVNSETRKAFAKGFAEGTPREQQEWLEEFGIDNADGIFGSTTKLTTFEKKTKEDLKYIDPKLHKAYIQDINQRGSDGGKLKAGENWNGGYDFNQDTGLDNRAKLNDRYEDEFGKKFGASWKVLTNQRNLGVIAGLYGSDGTFDNAAFEKLITTDKRLAIEIVEDLYRLELYTKTGAAIKESEEEFEQRVSKGSWLKDSASSRQHKFSNLFQKVTTRMYDAGIKMDRTQLLIKEYGMSPEVIQGIKAKNSGASEKDIVQTKDGLKLVTKRDKNGKAIEFIDLK